MVTESSVSPSSSGALTATDWARRQFMLVKVRAPGERVMPLPEGLALGVTVTSPAGAVFSTTV